MTHELRITMPSDEEIVHTRAFDARRADVFDALTKPELLARWYGPPGWTVIACESDLRPGGEWRIVTRQPSGREITQHGRFLEIVRPERFVKTERWLDWDVGEVRITTELFEREGRTTLVVTARFPSKAVKDALLASGADRDAVPHYEKLAAFLAS
jgi:uncharacterized protein YndB with AHSA1/START domain